MYPMNTQTNQWSFRSPIRHYNGISLWLGAITIIIIIKIIMHRFKWCMLLTQYSKHLILISQFSALTLITDWQSKKNRDIKATRVQRVKASVSLDGNRATLASQSFWFLKNGYQRNLLFLARCAHSPQSKANPCTTVPPCSPHTCKRPSKHPPVQPSLSYWMMTWNYVPMLKSPSIPHSGP